MDTLRPRRISGSSFHHGFKDAVRTKAEAKHVKDKIDKLRRKMEIEEQSSYPKDTLDNTWSRYDAKTKERTRIVIENEINYLERKLALLRNEMSDQRQKDSRKPLTVVTSPPVSKSGDNESLFLSLDDIIHPEIKPDSDDRAIDDMWASRIQGERIADRRPGFVNSNMVYLCQNCTSKLKIIDSESRLVCTNPSCGLSVIDLVCSNMAIIESEDGHTYKHMYERKKNFASWLKQFSPETPIIPSDVIFLVKLHYTRINPKKTGKMRPTPIKEILTSLGLKKWTDMAPRIAHRCNGIPIARFTNSEIQQCLKLFDVVQYIYPLVKDSVEINFPGKNFMMNKFMGILGWDRFRECFPLLKSAKVLANRDITWGRVCMTAGWKWERSV